MDKLRTPAGESRLFYGYLVVGAAFFIMLLTYGVRTSFGVFFKPMSAEFEWSRALTSGAVTVSMLVQGIWGILMGKVNDRIGSRWVITMCCFFLGLGLFLLSFTHSPWQLYLFYGILAGVGMGGVFVALVSTIARWFDKKRGAMTGLVLAGIGIGTLTMAPVTNWLINNYNWRTAYIVIAAVVFVGGALTAQLLKRDPSKLGQKSPGQPGETLLSTVEDKKGFSLKQAFAGRQFWMVGISFACIGYCTFTITVHLVPHVTDLGFSATTAANLLSLTGGIQSAGGIAMGILADKIGSKRIIMFSFVLISAALFWLVPSVSLLILAVCAVIYSFGIGGGTAMESTIVAELFGLKEHGVILGVISFGFTIGGAIGPVITGYLFDRTGNYQLAFTLCAALGLVGLILISTLQPANNKA